MPSVEELLIRLDATTEGLKRELRSADASIAGFQNNTSKRLNDVDDRFARLGKTIMTRLVPALSAAAAIRSVTQNIQAFEKIDIRLQRLTAGSQDYAEVQAYLSDQSQLLSVDLLALADNYARLLVLQKSGVIDRNQVNQLTTGLVDAAAALGATDKIGQVIYGLSQALSAGTVRAEDFNQVTEPLPGLIQSLEKAAGLASGGFRRMVNDGEVTSEFFATTMITALKDYEGTAESMSDTVGGAFTRLKNSWLSLSRTLGEAGFSDATITALDGLSQGVSTAETRVESLADWVSELDNRMRLFLVRAGIASNLAAPPGGFSSYPLPEDNASTIGLYQFQDQLKNTMTRLNDDINKVNASLNSKGSIDLKGPVIPGVKPQEVIDAGLKAQEEAAKKAQARADSIQKLIDTLKFENDQLKRNSKEQEIYNQLRAAGVTIDSAAGQQIKVLVEEQQALADAQEKTKEKTEGLKDAARDLGMTFTSAFEDAVVAGEDLSSVMQGLFQDIARIVLRKGATEPLGKLFSGIVEGIDFGSIIKFANGGVMGAGGSLPLKRYASGGIASSPQLAMFGEGKRPEAYVPLPDGRSIPVTMSGGQSSGGMVFNQSISIDARGADESFTTRWPAMKAELIRDTKAAVAAEANRGGSFSKSVGRRN